MSTMPDKDLLLKLKSEANVSFEMLYKSYFPGIAAYIRQNSGGTADAEDVFQEAIIVLLQNVRKQEFTLSASLKTYLYSVAKNLWLKRLRDNKVILMDDFPTNLKYEQTLFVEFEPEKSTDERVEGWLSRITNRCQHLLKAIFYYREPMDALIKKMGWKNKHTAANQRYKCIQQVKKVTNKEIIE